MVMGSGSISLLRHVLLFAYGGGIVFVSNQVIFVVFFGLQVEEKVFCACA